MGGQASGERPAPGGGHANALSQFEVGDEKLFYKSNSDLLTLATHFVTRSYLEGLTELPRMQDVPGHAFLTACENPIFISHAWLGPNRPDDGILNTIRSFVPNAPGVGLWIDYCCLPQKRRDGTDDRTEKEKQFFKTQLQYIPTILLKSQLVVLWDARHLDRGWCFIELVLADIFKNVIMKQVYHCKEKLSEAVLFATQTYDPVEWCIVRGVVGELVAKILLPHNVKDLPAVFYNSMLNQLGLKPTLLTTLLGQVRREHIDRFFEERGLKCTNIHDVGVLKDLLLNVCGFAGSYDVTNIKWPGKISYHALLPYIMANTSAYTVNLVDYHFSD